jgi:hypothetical protein
MLQYLMEDIPMCYGLKRYKRIRQTHLVYLLFIVELAIRPDDNPAGSKHVANSKISSK